RVQRFVMSRLSYWRAPQIEPQCINAIPSRQAELPSTRSVHNEQCVCILATSQVASTSHLRSRTHVKARCGQTDNAEVSEYGRSTKAFSSRGSKPFGPSRCENDHDSARSGVVERAC